MYALLKLYTHLFSHSGSFINIMFVIGGARSFGIIFVHLTEHFDASSASAAWSVGLLIFGMSFYGK